jgi:chemosensory pili system protein ChpA (sensor histidine kinase/response regulator)
MVAFDSVAGRLQRVVRQAADESGKQARLEIDGGAIELDRAVLDRMVPAFEHVLRNSVVHGIEKSEPRVVQGKDSVGLISIQVRQTGSEVAITFDDDGAGLALDRIRARALELGLIGPDDHVGDAELGRLIFRSGFSTAEQVTELAGRGVGMDVVQADVEALGGRIRVDSRPGRGASFHLTLPMTTALTRVVMMRAGDLVFGVPSGLVETVRRPTAAELDQAYARASFPVGAENLPFFWAGALLQRAVQGQADARSMSNAVVVFRAAARRIAVHVDEVLGNQEVMIKGLGPQLSSLPGLVATTVLTNGAVALIYNPVALVPVYDALHQVATDQEAAAAPPGPPLVLVVDDSITVRRVMQRLLRRQGYRVALAADGQQGLDQIAQERPALVLTDIEMPRMDGFELLHAIRSDGALADLPVVVITSRAAEKHRDHAHDLGASHYLGKPYSENELLGLVRTYAAPAPAAASPG